MVKEKWLIALIYNLHPRKENIFFWYLTNLLEFYSTWYEKVIIRGYFNIEAENIVMKDFFKKHTFYNMMKQNTCSKGDEGLYINLLITKSKFSFLETNSFETGLSDNMIYIILKAKFEKFEPKKLIYHNFKQYDSGQFKLDNCNSMSAIRTHASYGSK